MHLCLSVCVCNHVCSTHIGRQLVSLSGVEFDFLVQLQDGLQITQRIQLIKTL